MQKCTNAIATCTDGAKLRKWISILQKNQRISWHSHTETRSIWICSAYRSIMLNQCATLMWNSYPKTAGKLHQYCEGTIVLQMMNWLADATATSYNTWNTKRLQHITVVITHWRHSQHNNQHKLLHELGLSPQDGLAHVNLAPLACKRDMVMIRATA